MNRDQLLAESRKLSRQERTRFVLELVCELEDDDGGELDAGEGEVHDAWTEELRRRWDEVRAGSVEPLTVEQFRQRVRELREARNR